MVGIRVVELSTSIQHNTVLFQNLNDAYSMRPWYCELVEDEE